MKKVGIYNPNLATRGGGEKVCLALAEALTDSFKVLLITEQKIAINEIESYFGVSIESVEIVIIKIPSWVRRLDRLRIPDALRNIIKNRQLYNKIKQLNLDIFINNAYNTELPAAAPVGVYMCMFPHRLPDKNEMGPSKQIYAKFVEWLSRFLYSGKYWLDTYQIITANSKFTQHYIQKYWSRSSEILYPISDDSYLPNVKKEKIILNVGRFFHNNGITHHKRQDTLIEAFAKMTDLHKTGWQLHFAGTVTDNFHDMAYALEMIRRAEGLPIYFHFDMPLNALKELYSKSTIYWHATGYGSNVEKSPERQEHFGIATVEAMSAGAIPVVINSAGQQEVVKEDASGYLWHSKHELIVKTRLAIQAQQKLHDRVVIESRKYNKNAFVAKIADIFKPLV